MLMFDQSFFQVGGSLRHNHPSYIERQADRDLYTALKQQEYCYVLNSRQMGKTSLRVRTARRLQQEGDRCVAIDLGTLSEVELTQARDWYGALVDLLWRRLKITSGLNDGLNWWSSQAKSLPSINFLQFIEDVLLTKCSDNVVIFLDEIDNLLNLDFRDGFLSLLRNCHENRVENPQYNRLTFCLLGVATPSNLRIDRQRNPFNIGRGIQLTGFNLTEAQPLIQGLSASRSQPEAILDEILHWTQGQPFLTQKICSLVACYGNADKFDLKQLMQQQVIDNWEIHDQPEHLKTIRDRILYNPQRKARLLTLYQQILRQQSIVNQGLEEQVELRLSGIVKEQQGRLVVSNPIYRQIFNQSWVEQQLLEISPYQDALGVWLKSGKQDRSRLLTGEALAEGQIWAQKHPITEPEREFLQQSELLAAEQARQAKLAMEAEFNAKKLAQKQRLIRWQRLFLLFTLSMITGFYLKSRQANWSNITTLVRSSEALFASNQKLEALITAIQAQEQLNESWGVPSDLDQRAGAALQKVIYDIKEYDRLEGHRDRLHGIAIAEDGQLLATASTDNTVRLWHRQSGGWQPGRVLQHDNWVVDVAISPDGQTIASASRDRTVKLWNRQGQLTQTLNHPQRLASIAIKPNQQLVSGSEDGTIQVWHQGRVMETLEGHNGTVNAIAITADDAIISASEDRTLKIWREGKVSQTLTGHSEGVRAVTLTADGSKIISGSRDKTLKIWDSNGTEIATLRGHSAPVYGVAINPLNQQIVSASGDKTLKIWDSNGTEIGTLRGHTGRVWDVVFTPEGNIASASWDQTVKLWQPSNQLTQTLSGHQDVVIALDYAADLIASTSDDKTVKLWQNTGTLLATFRQHTAEVYDVAIHQQLIASVGADQTLKLWQRNGNLSRSIPAHQAPIWSVAIDAQGQRIVTGGNDNSLKIWDLTGNLLGIGKGHQQKIWDLAISPQNQSFVSASEDNTLKIWDLEGNLLRTLKGHQDAVRTVAYSSDGTQIISGSEDRSLIVWDLEGKAIATLKEHTAPVKGVALSPDNQYLASVDDSGTIILWHQEHQSWYPQQTIQGQDNSIWSVAFSPDGKTLATAGEDNKIKLWNLAQISALDPLTYGCYWLKSYLQTRTEGHRRLCQTQDK